MILYILDRLTFSFLFWCYWNRAHLCYSDAWRLCYSDAWRRDRDEWTRKMNEMLCKTEKALDEIRKETAHQSLAIQSLMYGCNHWHRMHVRRQNTMLQLHLLAQQMRDAMNNAPAKRQSSFVMVDALEENEPGDEDDLDSIYSNMPLSKKPHGWFFS